MSLRPQYKSPAIIKTQSCVVDCGRVTTDDDLGIGSAAAVDCCLSPKRKTARCPAAAAAGIGGREGDISTETEEEEIPPCPAFFFFFSPAPRWRPFSSPPHRSLSRASAAGAIDRSGEDRRLCRRVFLTPPPPTSKRERVNVILFSYVFQQSALQIWLLLCKLGNLTLFLVCKRWGTKKKKTIDENGWWSLYPPQKTLYHVYDALLLKEPPLSFHFKTLFLGVILSLSLCYTHNWQVATFPGDNTDCFLCVYVFSFFQYLTKNPLFSLSFLSGGHKVVEDFNSF